MEDRYLEPIRSKDSQTTTFGALEGALLQKHDPHHPIRVSQEHSARESSQLQLGNSSRKNHAIYCCLLLAAMGSDPCPDLHLHVAGYCLVGVALKYALNCALFAFPKHRHMWQGLQNAFHLVRFPFVSKWKFANQHEASLKSGHAVHPKHGEGHR